MKKTSTNIKQDFSFVGLEMLPLEEYKNLNGGGFWKDIGKFLGAWGDTVNDYSADGSNPVVLMGGA